MSTTINLAAEGRERSAEHRWADQVRVYDPELDGVVRHGAAIVLDLKAGGQVFERRIGFAFLTRDEAIILARAIIREARLSRQDIGDNGWSYSDER